MKIFVIKRLLKYFSFLFSRIDRMLVNKPQQEIKHQPVFIIGAPRTGSTILYQLITDYLDVNYINNFKFYGYRSLYICSKMSDFIFKGKPHLSKESVYGNTDKEGLNAPNEGGLFFHQWLPKKHDYISAEDALNYDSHELKNYITKISNHFEKPIVFKNLNCGMRIALLTKMFPDSKFIYIKRKQEYTIQSILTARRKRNTNPNEWWSVKPKDFEKLFNKDLLKQVSLQVIHIENQIEEDLKRYSSEDNVLCLNYEEFDQMESILKKVSELCQVSNLKQNIPQDLTVNIRNKVSDPEFARIKETISSLKNDNTENKK